jgi:tetratricopeptide (TPR) repeat protein
MWRLSIMIALASLAARGEQNAGELLRRALELHQKGDIRNAIVLYQQYIESGPPSLDAFTNYGAALAHEGQYAKAIDQYNQALHIDATHPPALLNLALAYYKTGRAADARAKLEAVRPVLPDNLQVAALLADCDIQMGDYKQAVEILEPFDNDNPDPTVSYLLGTALIRDNQNDRGARIIDRIMRGGDSAQVRFLLGTAKIQAKDYAAAATDLTKAVELEPDLPDVHAYLGLALLDTGETEAAEKAFRRELEINRNSFLATLQLGFLEKQRQRFPEARSLFESALALRPADAGVRYQIATVDLATGRLEDARGLLETLIREAPDFREAHVTLSTVYYRLKRKDDGDRERAIVRQQSPDAPQAGAK